MLLVLFCTVALQWDRVSCQSNTQHLVPVGNVWSSERPADVTLNRNGDECDMVMNLSASQRCEFVKNTPDCTSDEGFIKYPWVTFCLFPPNLLPLVITLYVIWLFGLFLILGLIASDLKGPNGAVGLCVGVGMFFVFIIFLYLMEQGVTFLALGNGAPDVFSAMAAFSHPQTAGLAIGALFGAGIFVTTVVAGSIALVKPFTVASRPFLRDVIFYMAAVFWTFNILYKGHISLGEALGYLGLYIVYVLIVIVSAYVYNRQKHQLNGSAQSSGREQDGEEYEPLLPYNQSTAQIFLNAINPVDSRTWRRRHWSGKVLKVIKVPVEVLLLLTVPVVDTDKEDHNWKRPLNCLHIITGPLVCVLTFQSGKCFVVSALWISTVASEIVSVLHLLGVVLRLSNTVLGLTLLAWGNSIGDCFADITIARRGYPRMAISACFGGIIFNMLFGVGLGCLLQMFQNNNVVTLEPEGVLCWVLSGALGLSLVFSFIAVPLQCFHLNRVYGIFLLIFYIVFLIVALLTEFRIIQF
ncbi:Mitochondrial sodium/calcium exchanger protein [Anabarilius grahami]|uniref:Mitochondrial sodium/calcium exchanger protein n=1 Tax=Anabarilius grahami TaxID=495550 RepID=A0A3N0YI03_ANAGA|nr:Mitochondrial sodium/calcium exchanger protein [Anabarilius grahami]